MNKLATGNVVAIAKPKITQVEETKWNDKVFTGDTAKNAATLTFFARQREMNTMNDRYKARQTTVDPTITERLFIDRTSNKNLESGTNLEG